MLSAFVKYVFIHRASHLRANITDIVLYWRPDRVMTDLNNTLFLS